MNIVDNKNFKKVSLLSLITLIILSSAIAPAKCSDNEKESTIYNSTTITLINEEIARVEMEYEFNLNEKIVNEIKEKFPLQPAFITLSSNGISAPLTNKRGEYSNYMNILMFVNVNKLQRTKISESFDINVSILSINKDIIEFDIIFENPFKIITNKFNELTESFNDVSYQYELKVCSQLDEWNGWLQILETKWISNCMVYKSPMCRVENLPKKHLIQFNLSKVLVFDQSYYIGSNGNVIHELYINLEIPRGKLRYLIPSLTTKKNPKNIEAYIIPKNGIKRDLIFYEDLYDPKEILKEKEYGWAYGDKGDYIILAYSDPDATKLEIYYKNKKCEICDEKENYVYECKFPILIFPTFKDDIVVTIDINDFDVIYSNFKFKKDGNKLIYEFEDENPEFIEFKYQDKEKIKLNRIGRYNIVLSFIFLLIFLMGFFRSSSKLEFLPKYLRDIPPEKIFISSLSFLLASFVYYLGSFYELSVINYILCTKLYCLGIIVFIIFYMMKKYQSNKNDKK